MLKIPFHNRDIGLLSIISTAAAPALGLSGAATAGVSVAAFAAEELIRRKIGQGRKAADAWVKGKTGQDAFQKDILAPAAIIAQSDPQKASQLVSQAWGQYLQAANSYAIQGSNQAKVIKQNLQTPAFMQTVQSLVGRNPLGSEFTQSLGTALPQVGSNLGNLASIIQTIAPVIQQGGVSFEGDTINRGPGDGLDIPSQPSQPPVDTNPATLPGSPQTTDNAGPYDTPTQPDIAQPRGPGVLSRIGGILSGGGGTNAQGGGSLWSKILPSLVTSIPGVIGSVIQSRAVGNAANAQLEANDKSLNFLKEMFATQQANQKPWLEAGTNALTNLSTMMAPGGRLYDTFNTKAPENTPFVAPTAEEAAMDPGWQFRLQEGMKAIERSQASKLKLLNPAATKELQNYAQGSASQEYGNVYNRRLGENQQAYNDRIRAFELNQGQGRDIFNQNAAIAGLGQTAANVSTQAAGQFGEAAAGNATNAGNISGAADIAGGNILGSTLANVGNNIQEQLTLQQIMSQINRQPNNQTGYRG